MVFLNHFFPPQPADIGILYGDGSVMLHKHWIPVFLMVSLFFLMGPVPRLWAEDSKPTSPPPAGDELGLTLRQVVETTLKNNVTIAVEEFNSKIREQDITDRKSEFDPLKGEQYRGQ